MAEKRGEKKSETLEIRLPHSKKQAFMRACEEEGITASHAVRTFIDAYLRRHRRVKLKSFAQEMAMHLIRNPLKTAGTTSAFTAAALATLFFSAQPSIAQSDAFTILDKNGDGVLSDADCEGVRGILDRVARSVDADNNGELSPEEFELLEVISFKLSETNGQDLRLVGDIMIQEKSDSGDTNFLVLSIPREPDAANGSGG
ncbi:MAG: hypothetical protein AAGJ29_08450 [Pseudomonadota bacterium]